MTDPDILERLEALESEVRYLRTGILAASNFAASLNRASRSADATIRTEAFQKLEQLLKELQAVSDINREIGIWGAEHD